MSTKMDGFIGSGVAAESVLDATTILHGPGGCRIHLSRLSGRYVKREFEIREGDYFFHFERVPCTFIDRDDYIYGASKKIALVLEMLENENTKFATILQSPGASLIGDKLKDEVLQQGLDYKTAVMDTSFMSEKFSVGFDTTLVKMAEKIVKPNEKRKGTVNIIGLPFTSRGYYELVKELRSVLGRMGIEVIATIGCGCTLDEFSRSSSAEFNIAIMPEYSERLSKFYLDEYGIPTIRSEMGAPIGYYAMRAFVETIAGAMGVDAGPILKDLEDDRHMVEITIDSSMNVGELLNYKTFSIEGESSVIYPLADFMIRYMKMVPKSIHITESDPFFEKKIMDILEKMGCTSAIEEEFGAGYTNILFGAGSYVKLLQEQNRCGIGVDICLPSQDMIDIAPKSIMGIQGLHKMLDDILNSR
jgi:nitrogenase molybdenum-iron protein alpha/beta subunit